MVGEWEYKCEGVILSAFRILLTTILTLREREYKCEGIILSAFKILLTSMVILYTSNIVDIASKHGILIHLYADDTQLYIKLSAKDIVNAKSRLLACFSDIQAWCASMRLKLNASKTELIWFNRLLTP